MKPAAIGVDIGSSSIKVLVLDVETNTPVLVVNEQLDSRVRGERPAHYEEYPHMIRNAAFDLIRRATLQTKELGYTVGSIGFTGQMHGGMLVDKDLEPLTNFISWQDKRGDEEYQGSSYAGELRKIAGDDETGVGIHTGFAIVSLFWLNANHLLDRRRRYILGIYDWLTSLLVGRAVADITSAAAWGMFDIGAKGWKRELLAEAGIETELLPEVVEPGASVGQILVEYEAMLGLPKGVSVVASIGDSQASYIGSGCSKNEILLNVGTGSQSIWETGTPIATAAMDIRYLQNNHYLVTAPTLAGGKAYSILAEFFRQTVESFTGLKLESEGLFNKMNELAMAAPDSSVVFDPLFSGSRFRNHDDRASILGLSESNFNPGVLARSLLKGMIEEIALPYFLREGVIRHSALVASGNGMRKNYLLQQIASERFGLPIRQAPFGEEAALGAAILAAKAL